jgi:hypothetical protein
VKRRNIQEAFVGEPDGAQNAMDNMVNGTEAVDIEVRSGKLMLVVPAGTPDDQLFDKQNFLGGEMVLEDGRILSFEIQDGAVGANATVKPGEDESQRTNGLSSIPDVPGAV